MPSLRLIAFAVCVFGLGACAKEAGDSAAATGAAAPARSDGNGGEVADTDVLAIGSGDFRIVSVALGNAVDGENLVLGDSSVFGRKDRIHASVVSTGASQGLRLSAKWLAPDGAVVAETMQALVPTAPTVATFTISNAQPWPAGEYRLLIAVNGHVQQTRAFHVR